MKTENELIRKLKELGEYNDIRLKRPNDRKLIEINHNLETLRIHNGRILMKKISES